MILVNLETHHLTQNELEEAFQQMLEDRKSEFNSATTALMDLNSKIKSTIILKKTSVSEYEISPYPNKYSFVVKTSNIPKTISDFLKVPGISILKISLDGVYNEDVVLKWESFEIQFKENRDN